MGKYGPEKTPYWDTFYEMEIYFGEHYNQHLETVKVLYSICVMSTHSAIATSYFHNYLKKKKSSKSKTKQINIFQFI